jgi:hypothetical protein
MVKIHSLWRDMRATSAAEFALVLPLLLVLILGTIDAGRFMWEYNRAEKATQAGARMAVVTDIISPGVASASYVGTTVGGTTLTQGDRIPAAAMGTVHCISTGCSCSTTPCPTLGTADTTAFNRVATRMQYVYPNIHATNVSIDYSGSNLGFAGDPNGSELSPLVTVKLTGLQFKPITFLLFATMNMPSFSATLSAEDLSGTESN